MYFNRQALRTTRIVCKSLLMETNEVFSIKLNEEGAHWLRRLQSLAMFILLATVFYNAINLHNTLPYVLDANKETTLPAKWRLSNSVFVIYLIIHAILQVIHTFLYYQFAVSSRQAITEKNSIQLNQSLRFLYWQAVTLLLQVCFSLAYFLFSSLIKNLN